MRAGRAEAPEARLVDDVGGLASATDAPTGLTVIRSRAESDAWWAEAGTGGATDVDVAECLHGAYCDG